MAITIDYFFNGVEKAENAKQNLNIQMILYDPLYRGGEPHRNRYLILGPQNQRQFNAYKDQFSFYSVMALFWPADYNYMSLNKMIDGGERACPGRNDGKTQL